jgi:hypothetical protein
MSVRLDATGVQPRKLFRLEYIGHDIRGGARTAWTRMEYNSLSPTALMIWSTDPGS